MIDIGLLREAGLSDEQIVAVLDIEQRRRLEKYREQTKLRVQRWRDRKKDEISNASNASNALQREKRVTSVTSDDAGFDEFWKQYPNKVGKAAARKAFDRVVKTGIELSQLMEALLRYSAKTDDRLWCNPATWLNQERWTDQPAEQPKKAGVSNGKLKTAADVAHELVENSSREASFDFDRMLPQVGRSRS